MRLPLAIEEARECRLCELDLPLGPRPLLQGSRSARVLVIGQAPGRAAHESGIPWDDRSGARLREWLGVEKEVFYDEASFALLPMGFCYPGRGPAGDLPPRPVCAPTWHDRLLRGLSGVTLKIYVGTYAVRGYLSGEFPALTRAVAAWRDLSPERVALPHPSGRNARWFKKNPWFEEEVVPALRQRVAVALGEDERRPSSRAARPIDDGGSRS